MSSPPLLLKEELVQWLTRRLGEPYNKCELTQDHYDDALESALRWFTAKKGLKKTKQVQILAGVNAYDIPDDVDTIIDVTFPTTVGDFSYIYNFGMFPGQSIPANGLTSFGSNSIFSTFVQNIQYIEMAKRIMGTEPDWRQEDRILYIFPIPGNTIDGSIITGTMWWQYKSNDVVLGKLNERDHDLVKRYCLAFCKRDLGMIRDRFGVYPGAQGMVPSDGKRLLQEAEQEFQQIFAEIELSGFPMGFITG